MSEFYRKKAAQLARDLYSNKIDYKTFALNYPDNTDDIEIKELLDLIEHEPKKGGLFGVDISKHGLYMAEINRYIDKLELENLSHDRYIHWFDHYSIRFERSLADEIGFDGIIKILNLKSNDNDVNGLLQGLFFFDFYCNIYNGVFLREFPRINSWPNTNLIYLNLETKKIQRLFSSKSSYLEWTIKQIDGLNYELNTQMEKQIITVP